MPRRRKKINDFDIVVLILFVIFYLVFTYGKKIDSVEGLHTALYNSIAILFVVLIFIVFVCAIIAMALKIWRATRQHNFKSSKCTPPVYNPTKQSSPKKHSQAPHAQKQSNNTPPNKPTKWSLELIKSIDWKLFEELCEGYFKAKGHKAKVTGLGADNGIDIKLYGRNDPEKILGIVQCKAWKKWSIDVKEIRALRGIMADINCPLGVYMTTSHYTKPAQAFAADTSIKLIDGMQLLTLIQELPMKSQTDLLKKATAGDYTTPSCVKCGMKMVKRTAKKGKHAGQDFWGCSNYPHCKSKISSKNLA